MTPPPRRPWWKKKRWAAAGLLWLAVMYPLSRGPAAYAVGRGWLPAAWERTIYAPSELVLPRYGPPTRAVVYLNGARMAVVRPTDRRTAWFYDYVDWWSERARNASD